MNEGYSTFNHPMMKGLEVKLTEEEEQQLRKAIELNICYLRDLASMRRFNQEIYNAIKMGVSLLKSEGREHDEYMRKLITIVHQYAVNLGAVQKEVKYEYDKI